MAVRTTGIYCRPSCPARTPAPGNVEFFATSAAAHIAGYRACKRCLPEAQPSSPEWNLRETTAARAVRLIADGVVEREGVSGLAGRLGYSQRQLNRLLATELGAGPLALARAHRAHNARQLIVSTRLPMSDVAFAAGFSSVRQFNDTVTAVFDMTPSELRVRAERSDVAQPNRRGRAPAAGTVRVALAHRRPFDAAGLFRWFATRGVNGVEHACARRYARTLRLAGGAATVSVEMRRDRLEAELRVTELADLPALITRTRRLFDLDADPFAIDAVLGADRRLAPFVRETPGMRLPGFADLHEGLVHAIAGQQVTVASARGQVQRLVDELGTPLPGAKTEDEGEAKEGTEISRLTKLFPSPAAIAERGGEVLRGPASRKDTLTRVCAALATGELVLDVATPREEFSAQLQAIRGIGPWTADYVALRFLEHPDVFLAGDVAARAGARAAGLGESPAEILGAAEAFAPWRSYLMMHLWRIAERKGERP